MSEQRMSEQPTGEQHGSEQRTGRPRGAAAPLTYADGGLTLTDDADALERELCRRGRGDGGGRGGTSVVIVADGGRATIDVDGARRSVSAGEVLLCRPGHRAGNVRASSDWSAVGMLISSRFGHSVIAGAGNLWHYLLRLDAGAVAALSPPALSLAAAYHRLLGLETARRGGRRRRGEVVVEIVRCMLYGIIDDLRLSGELRAGGQPAADRGDSPRGLALFHRFMELLEGSDGPCTRRDIGYYADRLCVTPKYLSTVCRNISGRSARVWISDSITGAIEERLRRGDCSIKEIAAEMGFPGLSGFSKFVKSRLGVAPSQVRGARDEGRVTRDDG